VLRQFFTRTIRRPFVLGLLAGVALIWVLRVAINETSVADRIIAPLLVPDTRQPSDAIVVLGAGVLQGCVPNRNGVGRVLLAVRLWREGTAPVVLFTGGGSDPACPVAKAMALLARDVGLPETAIRQETASLSTWENGAISAPLLRGWGYKRLLIVTDRLHMRRASAVFERLGFDVRRASVPIGEGHDDNISMLRAGIREFLGLGYYRLRGRTGLPDTATASGSVTVAPKPAMVKTGPVVVLGASYAEGWKPGSIGGVPVINRGIAGQQSFELLARFDNDVVPERPRAVILWGFINDIFRAPSDTETALTRVRESYAEMIARARRNGIEPVLATEVTIRPPAGSLIDRVRALIGTIRGKEAYQDRINRQVMAVNQWIAETAAREGLLVLQFQSVLSEPGGRRSAPFAQPDGSHITQAGYDALTSYATPILEEFLVVR
jgi:uncharacterized SAM-binding protein YcdF (DUF218 family)/lysophospholipase L1-like esterase